MDKEQVLLLEHAHKLKTYIKFKEITAIYIINLSRLFRQPVSQSIIHTNLNHCTVKILLFKMKEKLDSLDQLLSQ